MGKHDTRGEIESRSINKATMRVLTVLSAFVGTRAPMGASELSRDLGMTRNMVHRALVTLVDEGLLHKDADTGRYLLSYNLARMQNTDVPAPDLRQLARPYLEELSARTNETVQLCVRSGDVQTVIDGVEGRGTVALRVKLGRATPLHASVASRAILAAMSDLEVAAYVSRNEPLVAFSDSTITDPDALMAEVREVRARGYAVSFGDFNPQTAGFAFALCDSTGRPHGAVAIGGPRHRISGNWVETMAPQLEDLIAEMRTVFSLYDVT